MEPSSEIREEENNMKLFCIPDILGLIEEGQMHRAIQVLQQGSKTLPSFFSLAGHGSTPLKKRPKTQKGRVSPWGPGDMGNSHTGRACAMPVTGRSKIKPRSLVCGCISEMHVLAHSNIA